MIPNPLTNHPCQCFKATLVENASGNDVSKPNPPHCPSAGNKRYGVAVLKGVRFD